MGKHAGTIVAVILIVLVVGGIAYYMSTRPAAATTPTTSNPTGRPSGKTLDTKTVAGSTGVVK